MGSWCWARFRGLPVPYTAVVPQTDPTAPGLHQLTGLVGWSQINQKKKTALLVITQELNKNQSALDGGHTGDCDLPNASRRHWILQQPGTGRWPSMCQLESKTEGQNLKFQKIKLLCGKLQGNLFCLFIFWDLNIHSSLCLCVSSQFNKSLSIIHYVWGTGQAPGDIKINKVIPTLQELGMSEKRWAGIFLDS